MRNGLSYDWCKLTNKITSMQIILPYKYDNKSLTLIIIWIHSDHRNYLQASNTTPIVITYRPPKPPPSPIKLYSWLKRTARCTSLCLLSAYAKLQKATINFVSSVRPHGTTRLPLDGFSLNLTFEYFSKICPENSESIKKNWALSNEAQYTFFNLARLFLLKSKKMFQTKVVEKIKPHFWC